MMKNIKRSAMLALLVLLAASCNNNDSIIIKGRYPGEGHDYIYINRVNLNNPVPVDSARISKKGSFRVRMEAEEPAFYTLGFDNNEFITVVAEPGDRISLDFNSRRMQNGYTVSGSTESEKVRQLDKKLGQTILALDSINTEYREATESGDEEKAAELEKLYLKSLKEQRMHNIGFILDNLSKLSAIKALYQSIDENTYVLYEPRDLQYLKLVSDSLSKYYPDITLTNTLMENLESELNQMYVNRITREAEQAEALSLDADLRNVNGQRIRLSEVIKNNYVLLSFWSAESKECVSNNMHLKQMYRLYHNSGFEIYQVNLDNDESLWKKSLRFDELPWISVREDDPSKPVIAGLFNVSRVPSNYLFDMNGDIIGKDLFGRSLKIKLGQIFD
ncbi:MAG: thioredoxin-like domain-containing protein [Bacteroidales bacterium]